MINRISLAAAAALLAVAPFAGVAWGSVHAGFSDNWSRLFLVAWGS